MSKQLYFFIDESGDPNFYARRKRPLWTEPTFKPILMMGMVVVENKLALYQRILAFQDAILADPLFNTIYSVKQPNWFLHASKDHADIRLKFIEFLRKEKDIKCYVTIGRKHPDIFHNKHNGKSSEFYFDMLNKLLEQFDYAGGDKHLLFLSERQSTTQERFVNALQKALNKQSKLMMNKHFVCRIVKSRDYPEQSVVDYFLWVLNWYITTGDKRYFAALEDKYEEIYDVYENAGKGRIYNKSDGFDISKASSFAIK